MERQILKVDFRLTKLRDFDELNDRSDCLYLSLIDKKHKEWLKVVQKLSLLSHGTADFESGFSINKDLIDDNQHIDTLIALPRSQDVLKHCGGLLKFDINKDVLTSVCGARAKYVKDVNAKIE